MQQNKLPSGDWRETLQWLEDSYEYPETGNYDWPDTTKPKVVNDHVRALDGTMIPVLRGAYDVSLVEGYSALGHDRPQCTLQYRIGFSGREDGKRKFDDAVRFFTNTYRLDFNKLAFTQYESAVEMTGMTKDIEVKFLIPGRLVGRTIEIYDGEDYMAFDYSLAGIVHFYFERTHLRVVDDNIVLTDGTVVPIFAQRKILKVSTGNVQGASPPETVVEYDYKLLNVKYHDYEFVNLYTFYARHFGFPVSAYKLWDQTNVDFTIEYEDDARRVRITSPGRPLQGALHADISGFGCEDAGYTKFFVELLFKNKSQKIPGLDEPLPRSADVGSEDETGENIDEIGDGVNVNGSGIPDVEIEIESERENTGDVPGLFEEVTSIGGDDIDETFDEGNEESCDEEIGMQSRNAKPGQSSKIKLRDVSKQLSQYGLMFEQYPNGQFGLMGMMEAREPAGPIRTDEIEISELERLLDGSGLKLVCNEGRYEVHRK